MDKSKAFDWLAEKLKTHKISLNTSSVDGQVIIHIFPEPLDHADGPDYPGPTLLEAVRYAAGVE